MLKRLVHKVKCAQEGITGLETAIILIAFVVVAAVFAYTVLSAGLFSTQKSSEAVYSGLESTQSTLELRGGVTAYGTMSGTGEGTSPELLLTSAGANPTTSGTVVTRISFTVAGVMNGEPIDLSAPWTCASTVDPPTNIDPASTDEHTTIITYDDSNKHIPDTEWTVKWIGNNDGDNLLENNEKATITVWLVEHDGTDFNLDSTGSTNGSFFSDSDDSSSYLVQTDHTFRLQVKTAEGAVLRLERTTPAVLDAVMDLH